MMPREFNSYLSNNEPLHKYPVTRFSQSATPRQLKNLALELEYFQTLGVGHGDLEYALSHSEQNLTSLADELSYNNIINRSAHYERMANYLDILYKDDLSEYNIVENRYIDTLLTKEGPLRVERAGKLFTVVSPSVLEMREMEKRLSKVDDVKSQFIISSPDVVRRAVWGFKQHERARNVVRHLVEQQPGMSAQRLISGWQGFGFGALVTIFAFSLYLSTNMLLGAIHLFFSFTYLAFNLIKLAAGLFPASISQPPKFGEIDQLPTYTVLVALYKEAPLAQQIVASLSRINWPTTKLDIKLVCEADDRATIDALLAANPGPQFEIIEVPDYGPRTKPKALQYALAGAKGAFVTIYDAEDIPHPNQMLEAYSQFCAHDEKLACLQAPLVITNARAGWLTSMFALEYSGLFRKIIPLLSHFGLPIPLGGTSNHFRKSALLAVGGWDPCNVTEDADLGVRLYRRGYMTKSLCHPTLENAPENIDVWVKQRTRWLKGWLQTWFVFMRNPVGLIRSLGFAEFIVLQILVCGMLIAAVAHPLMYLFVLQTLTKLYTNGYETVSAFQLSLLGLDSFNLVGGYCIFVLTGWRAFITVEKRDFKLRRLCMLPAYWLLMSVAAIRALLQLPNKAHVWEKTPHTPNIKPDKKS